MVLKAYYDLLSQPARAVLIFLRVNRIPHEAVKISIAKRENTSPEYAKINPFKKIPAINDDGFSLTESAAILRYLSDEHLPDTFRHWYPKDLKLRAKVNEYLDWHHTNTRLSFAGFVRTKLLAPIMTRRAADPAKLEELASGVEKTVQEIDSYFLQNRKFFLGDQISIADLQAACEVETVQAAGLDSTKNYPRVAEWMQRVRLATNPEFEEANKQIRRISKFLIFFSKVLAFLPFGKK